MVFLQGSVNPIALEKNLIISEQLIKCICKINNINKTKLNKFKIQILFINRTNKYFIK